MVDFWDVRTDILAMLSLDWKSHCHQAMMGFKDVQRTSWQTLLNVERLSLLHRTMMDFWDVQRNSEKAEYSLKKDLDYRWWTKMGCSTFSCNVSKAEAQEHATWKQWRHVHHPISEAQDSLKIWGSEATSRNVYNFFAVINKSWWAARFQSHWTSTLKFTIVTSRVRWSSNVFMRTLPS